MIKSAFDNQHLKIKALTVITQNGARQYLIGNSCSYENKRVIKTIILQALPVGEDRVFYYCGFDDDAKQPMLFSVSVNCPHEIEYE